MITMDGTAARLVVGSKESGDSLLLYGSYARGDYDATSDIDILRIATHRARGERMHEHVSIHTYDIKDLNAMAKQGSLFILHLLREAKPLQDPREFFSELRNAFVAPKSYAFDAKAALTPASPILNISEPLFQRSPQTFMSTAMFLCRTLVYAEHADRGPFSFSLKSLAEKDEIASILWGIKNRSMSYSDFWRLREIVRSKLLLDSVGADAVSIKELTARRQGDPLFDSLLRRIVSGLRGAPYPVASNNRLQATANSVRSSLAPAVCRA